MIIYPDWQQPKHVRSLSTTRYFCEQKNGFSKPPYDHFNLGAHVGDIPDAVSANRHLLFESMVTQNESNSLKAIAWLDQIHTSEVVERDSDNLATVMRADSQFTREKNLPLAILTADCLPVLLTDIQGTVVAAVHCGWRPLAKNILSKTVAGLQVAPQSLVAWFGPCISQPCFEVGAEVFEAFSNLSPEYKRCFKAYKANKFLADLRQIAQVQLELAQVTMVTQSQDCTFTQSSHFYSYRRDQQTGRMATLVWLG